MGVRGKPRLRLTIFREADQRICGPIRERQIGRSAGSLNFAGRFAEEQIGEVADLSERGRLEDPWEASNLFDDLQRSRLEK